ncbi:hypothetical protein RB195_025975 [Necator americanus]|uniref:Zinc knuckle n=1 Tax=Necator americanus TaxID=51031 RepID=A0ABR1EUR2_NECAM
MLVKSNNLVETFTELRGSRTQLFARREAALYRCRLERVHYEASNLMERIRSATETLSMAYDLYGLLVLADDTLSDEREDFYDDWEEGVIIRPCFTTDFIRKEVEKIDDFRRKVENEIKEAELQEKSENHASLFDQVKELFAELRQEFEEKHEKLRDQLKSMNESIEGIKMSMERLREHHGETSDQTCNSEDREPTRPHGDNSMPPSRNQGEGDPRDAEKHQEPEEDLLDFYDDYEVIDDHEEAGNQGTNHGSRESIPNDEYPGRHKRVELEKRRDAFKAILGSRRKVPDRRISHVNFMRPEERYLVCSFCLAKGQYYSDSCPVYVSVELRRKRVRCKRCLDSRHDTEHCWNQSRECMYCGSRNHNKTLCTLPECIHDQRYELKEIERELETFADYYGPGQ